MRDSVLSPLSAWTKRVTDNVVAEASKVRAGYALAQTCPSGSRHSLEAGVACTCKFIPVRNPEVVSSKLKGRTK